MPFSRELSQPKDQTKVSHIAGGFCITWDTRKDLIGLKELLCVSSEIPHYVSRHCPFRDKDAETQWLIQYVGKLPEKAEWSCKTFRFSFSELKFGYNSKQPVLFILNRMLF